MFTVMTTSLSFATDQQCIEVTDLFIQEAEHMSALVASFLDRLESVRSPQECERSPISLPREFSIELGAILRIAQWESDGLLDPTESELPGAADAYENLLQRCIQKPESFSTERVGSSLLLQVLKFSVGQLSWNASRELGADVVVGQVDDIETYLEAFAEFLWARRHSSDHRSQIERETASA